MKKLIFILLSLVLTASCIKQSDIAVKRVTSISAQSTSKATITVEANNLSRKKLEIKSADLQFKLKGKDFLKIKLAESIKLNKKSENQRITIPLNFKCQNPLALLSLIGGNSAYIKMIDNLELSGEIDFKLGAFKKKLKIENKSMNAFLSEMGVNKQEFINNLKL